MTPEQVMNALLFVTVVYGIILCVLAVLVAS
jgi:hypothetical protein